MADTGAPFFIPYQEPADIVRDYPAASEDLADAIAAGLTAAGNPGIGSNVVQTTKLNTFTTSSGTYVQVTDLNASITPSTDTSKVLIIAQITYSLSTTSAGFGQFKVTRAGTDIYRANADGSRPRAVFGGFSQSFNQLITISNTVVFLDSPGTTSSTNYRVEVANVGGGNVFINRSALDRNLDTDLRGASSITVIEVSA